MKHQASLTSWKRVHNIARCSVRVAVCSSAILLLGNRVSAQSKLLPFLGASLSFAGVSHSGIGAELGARYGYIYLGVETGMYGRPVDPSDTARSLDPHYFRTNASQLAEIYYAFDLGAVWKNLFIGFVVVRSHFEFVSGAEHWTDLGPDIRYEMWRHGLFGAAYTKRRGLNASVGFLF